MKKQSGFSLIEVVVALLILSIVVISIDKMLLASTTLYRQAEMRARAVVMVWSVIEDLSLNKEGCGINAIQTYWQEELEKISRGSVLTVQQTNRKDQWVYTITIQFGLQTIQPLILRKVVQVEA